MFIIYKNRGILIPVFVIVPLFLTAIISGELNRNFDLFSPYFNFEIIIGTSLLLSFIWTYLVSHDYIVVNGKKERIEMNNHFFYLSLRTCSYIMLVASILFFISAAVNIFN